MSYQCKFRSSKYQSGMKTSSTEFLTEFMKEVMPDILSYVCHLIKVLLLILTMLISWWDHWLIFYLSEYHWGITYKFEWTTPTLSNLKESPLDATRDPNGMFTLMGGRAGGQHSRGPLSLSFSSVYSEGRWLVALWRIRRVWEIILPHFPFLATELKIHLKFHSFIQWFISLLWGLGIYAFATQYQQP